MDSEIRTVDEVNRLLGFAKLDGTELHPCVQCLNFVDNLDNDAIKLLELDPSVLKHLQEGDRVVMRGMKSDSAVLCTKDKTFDVRVAETSNVLLLLPECSVGAELNTPSQTLIHRQVCGIKQEYFELRLIQPRLKRMKELLEENQYSGREYELDQHHTGRKYTLSELLDEVQSSEEELLEGLRNMQACLIEGYWRLLDFDFMGSVLQSLISLVDEQSWSMDALPAQQSCDILQELYPRNVVQHVLQSFAEECSPADDNEQRYKLSEDKICCFYAEMLLRPVDKFNLQEFDSVWQLAVPDGMKTSHYQLEGIALVDKDSKPQVIRHFSVTDLPEDVAPRFDYLFKTKDKWTLEDIAPYIRDLVSDKTGVSALLTKHCRSSTQSGIKLFSSKRPVS